MKKVILGAALCSAGIALATPATADDGNDWLAALTGDWWTSLVGSTSTSTSTAANDWWTSAFGWLFGVTGTDGSEELIDDAEGFLAGSTHALILGATGVPTPNEAYISAAMNLYLFPNGYEGDAATTLALTTPQTMDFEASVAEGQQILINAIMEEYDAGSMGCDLSGVCSDPLTIFTYSQSAAIAALAEQQLFDDGIPSDALRFVMLGANPLGVPNDLFPTEIFNIDGDVWADPASVGSTWQDIFLGMQLHEAYLGLSAEQIASATTTVDGLTTINEIPTLTMAELWEALMDAWAAGVT
ncbi:PE-PPE domain-containing protein [Candidatus Mycobacterium wuenschmannii]|uniref:PE-PPE domain-containing protein n=1 Tax=Candidatus Mycobacterium wuenschmannii TaxID=3027808 RepID=A0ABY8W2B6_9MYCO|nr:PE-PPE domain-containing protein [Candidatus Mycobacterium wuenschmannii]WIM90028.1 PE-PPE domain-containing protein [Candidatus Mycobacterium wuenschmannii]